MKQAVLQAPKEFMIRNINKPKIGANQAMLKVKAVGICGSDIHAYYGEHPFIKCPIVPGHEATGDVVDIGKEVTNVKIGDRVVIRPQKICNKCILCRTNRYNICNKLMVLGCQVDGACSEYYAVDADLLYRLPDNINYDAGTIIEPLAVGVHAVKRGMSNLKGKKVLVSGAGTIGNVVAQSAKALGAEKVMITDISEFKLDLAKKCGVDYTVNVKKKLLTAEIMDKFGLGGVDVIYECSASNYALHELLEIARKGTNIVIVGVFGNKVEVNMANIQDREYQIIGTLMYLHEDYLEAIELVKNNKVNLNDLITKEFELDHIAEAFQYIEDNKENVQKVLLNT